MPMVRHAAALTDAAGSSWEFRQKLRQHFLMTEGRVHALVLLKKEWDASMALTRTEGGVTSIVVRLQCAAMMLVVHVQPVAAANDLLSCNDHHEWHVAVGQSGDPPLARHGPEGLAGACGVVERGLQRRPRLSLLLHRCHVASHCHERHIATSVLMALLNISQLRLSTFSAALGTTTAPRSGSCGTERRGDRGDPGRHTAFHVDKLEHVLLSCSMSQLSFAACCGIMHHPNKLIHILSCSMSPWYPCALLAAFLWLCRGKPR